MSNEHTMWHKPFTWYQIISLRGGIMLELIKGDEKARRRLVYYAKHGVQVQAVQVHHEEEE